MMILDRPPIYIKRSSCELDVTEIADPVWKEAEPATINTYWSGESAPQPQHFDAALLWSDDALYVRFHANQSGHPVVSENPDLTNKVRGLWERDVCEIFIAPDKNQPNKYFEFEIAPTGEWIDLGIEITSHGRKTDWEYRSKMTSAARIEKDQVVMAMRIPWKALGRKPKAGDTWRGNFFRCVGREPTRRYLAWSPTMTDTPNFHVPSHFGRLIFDN